MTATCPRCAGELRPPNLWSSAWRCDLHGDVPPFRVAPVPSRAALDAIVTDAKVPVWVPEPLATGWTITGTAWAGDERTGAVATLTALSGPHPRGGPSDVLLIAEEPGTGLGAAMAGLTGTDPGSTPDGPPDHKIEAAGHPTAMWRTATGEDRTAYVGEACGVWLWVVCWPDGQGECVESLRLHDLREDDPPELALVFGALAPRLVGPRLTPSETDPRPV